MTAHVEIYAKSPSRLISRGDRQIGGCHPSRCPPTRPLAAGLPAAVDFCGQFCNSQRQSSYNPAMKAYIGLLFMVIAVCIISSPRSDAQTSTFEDYAIYHPSAKQEKSPSPSNSGTTSVADVSGSTVTPEQSQARPAEPVTYYENIYGQSVQAPTRYSDGVPPGASAQCADGSYSFSRSRSGTCSHHGGVSSWL